MTTSYESPSGSPVEIPGKKLVKIITAADLTANAAEQAFNISLPINAVPSMLLTNTIQKFGGVDINNWLGAGLQQSLKPPAGWQTTSAENQVTTGPGSDDDSVGEVYASVFGSNGLPIVEPSSFRVLLAVHSGAPQTMAQIGAQGTGRVEVYVIYDLIP